MRENARIEARAEAAARRAREGYNGWANYETWAVALWIDNEPGTHETRHEMARQAIEDAPDHENVPAIWSAKDAARFAYADALKAWIVDDAAPDLGATLWADLLGAALSEVDWVEIAGNWLDDEETYATLAKSEASR